MIMPTKELFQYFLILLFLLWPVWILLFLSVRYLYQKIGTMLGGAKPKTPAVIKIEEPSDRVEKVVAAIDPQYPKA
ncbi:MAG: hypothetical protein HY282_13160 [Nitrospirae bacterium]|nr:hypothetical protein [Candidatus Manganitrophaceae bacterium]